MHFCTCAECGMTKTKSAKNKTCGASALNIKRILNKGPSTTDKVAEAMSGL